MQKKTTLNHRSLVRARRLMSAALVLSVMGNRLVEGGFDGLASAGVISVATVVAVSTFGELTVILFPLYARLLRGISPNWALIGADVVEVALSLLAVAGVLMLPAYTHVFIVGYVLLDLLVAPVSDIADEFYGAGLAARSGNDALAFNATVDSMLAFFGFVVLAPLGSVIAAVSVLWLLAGNIVLSLLSIGSRLWSGSAFLLAAPRDEVDAEEYSAMGQRTPLSQFVHDLIHSGPASPLLSFAIQVAGALTGQLLFLWVASLSSLSKYDAMATVLLVFGLAATLGPQVGRWMAQCSSSQVVLNLSAAVSCVLVCALAVSVWRGEVSFVLALVFVFANVVVARARMSVLSAHRQTYFSGSQFERVMSWSYAFGGLGTMLGLQLGYWLKVPHSPFIGLLCAATIWLMVSFVRTSRH
ncbi:MFS transporter [Actinomyces vulturis]|uniref:MFS transporter n=1 Tax=Actinomyces vulturis TaxID=1857645 RepID=UPI000836A075|nr:MFS transporter [Actinomyces vulturis]